VFLIFIKVIYIIKREITDKVIIIKADNNKDEFGFEFIRKYNKNNIIFESCFIYKYFINKVNKRHIYTTDYKIKSLLFDADLLLKF